MADISREQTIKLIRANTRIPIRGIPFNVIIEALSGGHQVLKIDKKSNTDKELISNLEKVARLVGKKTQINPIVRSRPNEVGNDIENYIIAALGEMKVQASRPTSAKGLGLGVGYPDILITQGKDRFTYIEAKTYASGTRDTTMRSFYLSPSDRFKVSKTARHLIMAFEMERKPIEGENQSKFTAVAFKIADLYDLRCDLKQEFQSDNRRLYDAAAMLGSGKI